MLKPLVIWDLEDDPDGNVLHILEHGITPEEVEQVVRPTRDVRLDRYREAHRRRLGTRRRRPVDDRAGDGLRNHPAAEETMMAANRIHRPAVRTPEELAELRATRERLQREKPTPEQLLAESGHPDFVPLGDLLLLHELASEFRRQRERQGLTLADVSTRTGIDQSTLSRLETGKAGNPSLDTLQRVAAALGKRVRCHLEDAAPLAGAGV